MGHSEIEEPLMHFSGFLDLAKLTEIKSFTVPWTLYMGMEPWEGRNIGNPGTLPANLTSLIFTDGLESDVQFEWDDSTMLSAIREYLEEAKLRYTPHLRQFGVHSGTLEGYSRKELECLCEKANITSSFVDTAEAVEGEERKTPLPCGWIWPPPVSKETTSPLFPCGLMFY